MSYYGDFGEEQPINVERATQLEIGEMRRFIREYYEPLFGYSNRPKTINLLHKFNMARGILKEEYDKDLGYRLMKKAITEEYPDAVYFPAGESDVDHDSWHLAPKKTKEEKEERAREKKNLSRVGSVVNSI